MKIVFMGTPDFAAGSLKALIAAGHDIVLVVTQPDKPKGRSGALQPSPVKEVALEYGIPVFQPERIKRPEAVEELKKYTADIFVVAAFGQILSQEILDMPRLGCVNIHASLLPKYRGASPIQHVILDGEAQTGVTVMQMDAGLDTGDMLYKKVIDIAPDETFETLHDKLMDVGGVAIVEALPLIERGELKPEKQVDADSCYAKLIDKSMGKIDFSKPAVEIDRKVRGMNPWPSAFTYLNGKQLKIWRTQTSDGSDLALEDEQQKMAATAAGSIVKVAKDYFAVATGDGYLKIYELQLEGKKRMETQAFLLGSKPEVGTVLG